MFQMFRSTQKSSNIKGFRRNIATLRALESYKWLFYRSRRLKVTNSSNCNFYGSLFQPFCTP